MRVFHACQVEVKIVLLALENVYPLYPVLPRQFIIPPCINLPVRFLCPANVGVLCYVPRVSPPVRWHLIRVAETKTWVFQPLPRRCTMLTTPQGTVNGHFLGAPTKRKKKVREVQSFGVCCGAYIQLNIGTTATKLCYSHQ